MVSSFFILLTIFIFHHMVDAAPQVPGFFIFGDSLVDAGNNNLLLTAAKANFPPYGVDFPGGPTGRFCNGRTTADIITQTLGFDNFIPAFANSSFSDVLKGVNYASSSAGIREETGLILGAHFSLNAQLHNHESIILRIKSILRNDEDATKHLNNCLYYVGMGSNDLGFYFVLQLFHQIQLEQYIGAVVDEYSQQLTTLYNLGARKVAVIGLWRIGCTPASIAIVGAGGPQCVESMNQAAEIFNGRVKALVDQFNQKLAGAKFIYVDTYKIFSDSYSGFKVPNAGCCQELANVPCLPFTTPCEDHDDHMFWDGVHPSQALNQIIARRAYKAENSSDAYPYDISRLVGL